MSSKLLGAELRALLGAAVRAARERRGLSQHELARRAGLSAPMLSRIEAGRNTPSVPALLRLAEEVPLDLSRLAAECREKRRARAVQDQLEPGDPDAHAGGDEQQRDADL